jgi:hypothetical protein
MGFRFYENQVDRNNKFCEEIENMEKVKWNTCLICLALSICLEIQIKKEVWLLARTILLLLVQTIL